MKKNVLILTADAGFGHRSAANALAEAFRETRGRECAVEIVNGLEEPGAPRGLRESQYDYDRIARDMPELYRIGYHATGAVPSRTIIERGLQALLYRVMRRIVLDRRPDLILSTYPLYQAPLGAVFSINRKFIPLVTVVTDLVTVHRLWFNEYSDLTVVPTPAARRLALKAGLPAARISVLGIPVSTRLARAARSRRRLLAGLGWEQALPVVLLVGSTRSRLYADAALVLNHSGLPVQLAVVAGGDGVRYRELKRTKWHRPAHVYNYSESLPEMMLAADCIVCKAGGLIVSEALACGLPLILTDVIPGQETGNADFVVGGGAGVVVDRPLAVQETLSHWLLRDGELLRKAAARSAALGRPRAAYEIAKRSWELALRGPWEKETAKIPALPRLIEFFDRIGIKVEE